MEHSFLMQSALQDNRRRKDFRVLWLDLRNNPSLHHVGHDVETQGPIALY
jgi:hypothetical protein